MKNEAPQRETKGRPAAREVKNGRGRPVGDREAKRKQLLAAGISVIADLGYAGASLRKVAQRAGHTTGAVTYYFDNKEKMVAAIIEYMFDQFDTLLELGETATIKERFERWIEMNADSDLWFTQFQLLAQARVEPTYADIYQRRYGRYREGLAKTLKKEQAEGQVRDDISAKILADQLSAMADGWMMMMPIEPKRFAPRHLSSLLGAVVTLLQAPRAIANEVTV